MTAPSTRPRGRVGSLVPLPVPDVVERAGRLLRQWRSGLALNAREQVLFGPELRALDRQCLDLSRRYLHVTVFGRVGVGKSSLLNGLLGQPRFGVDVAHGSTRQQQREPWCLDTATLRASGLQAVHLVDTPGLDEVDAHARDRLASWVARAADLVLLVLGGDLSAPEEEALQQLRRSGKPVLIVLNRCDSWSGEQREELLRAIGHRLSALPGGDEGLLGPLPVAAAPRSPRLLRDGRVRSEVAPAEVGALRQALLSLLRRHGTLLLSLNSLAAADRLSRRLLTERLRRRRPLAQGLIGRYASAKAVGLALNPLMLLDLAGSAAADMGLALQLATLYGIPLPGPQARVLLRRTAAHLMLVGGAQLGVQGLLTAFKQILLAAAPLSGGLSLAPAAPVAAAQAALAVHTTRLMGRLAARELLLGASRGPSRPGALIHRLARQEPAARRWLALVPPRQGCNAEVLP
ncbi:MAG: DUF697 domain-containing protein [Aphanocapsa feldmannii 277cV]|uniref:DUF697 domain-containing protein n=2 Tax=Aphanocapsa feldmannii TaxID=192050 RepID=A0A524RKP9_9CHRO|nr:MAG: DUF697 domain-containing protein [Aphanocapsa feldmannii 277cV]TGH21954.1 MAG: DUF697 domain-containing protein [Aphanocapsa feldmannii 277cI]